MDRGQFIEVMVALRTAKLDLVQQDSVPEGRFDALRDSILTAHGVEPGELYAFVNTHPDLAYQEALWDSINRRLMRPWKADSSAAPEPVLRDSMIAPPQRPRPGELMERIEPDRPRR